MKNVLKLLSAVLIVTSIFCGCEKEELANSAKSTINNNFCKITNIPKVSQKMRTFESYEQLKEELRLLSEMTVDELVEYANYTNFYSFGIIADKVYFSIFGNEDALENITREELLEYITNNNEYIQIVLEEDNIESAETRYYKSQYRYIMNKDCMFQVKDDVYKIFENGYVYGKCSDIDDLKKMTEKEFLSLNSNNQKYHIYKYGEVSLLRETGNFGLAVVRSEVSDDGKERVKIWINYDRTFQPTYGRLELTTKGQRKTLGVFYDALRHITNNVTVKIYFPDGSIQTFTETTQTEQTQREIYREFATNFCWTGSYIYQLSGYCKIPAVRYTFPN